MTDDKTIEHIFDNVKFPDTPAMDQMMLYRHQEEIIILQDELDTLTDRVKELESIISKHLKLDVLSKDNDDGDWVNYDGDWVHYAELKEQLNDYDDT